MSSGEDERWVRWFMADRWNAAPGTPQHNLLVHAWRSLGPADDGRLFRALVMRSSDAERADALLRLVVRRPSVRHALSLSRLPFGHNCSHCPTFHQTFRIDAIYR
jgi:hypothetical protein